MGGTSLVANKRTDLFANVNIKPDARMQRSLDYMLPIINQAIKGAEGNPKNYGVLGAKSPESGNQILNNSIRNSILRWMQAGRPGKWVDFMRDRWAPLGAENDPTGLNYNWAPNVRKSLKKKLTPEEQKEWKRLNITKQPPWMTSSGIG